MARTKGRMVTGYARVWPRAVFDLRQKGDLLKEVKETLGSPGVYVLYKDEQPHYIGKTRRPLWLRIRDHANITADKFHNLWNFFSAFEVRNGPDRDEIEAVLIAAMPTANSANPRIHPLALPRKVIDALARRREIDVDNLKHATGK